MGDQQVLAFLRIDVDTAGDDHERRAVGEVEIAVRVDVADIAHRAHAAVRRARLPGAVRIVEIFKRCGGLEPYGARRARWARLHVLVENVEVAEQDPADRAWMGQPLLAVAGGEAQAFGCAIIFVDDWSPPFDDVVLHQRRAGRSGVDRNLERRQVVGRAHVFRQLQHPRKHRRHELCMGDAPALHQFEIPLGIEALHDNRGAACADREIDGGLRRRMIKRCRR